ncbi:MAG: OmpL47-type beta-barrel domain-containing protein, partial [Thermoplasmatota archaeon]
VIHLWAKAQRVLTPFSLKQNTGNSYTGGDDKRHYSNNSEFEIGEEWDPFGGFAGYRIIYRLWWNGTKTWTSWMYGPWNDSVTFTLDEECKHYVEWYVIDTAGNNESEPNWVNLHNQTLYVDDSPPITPDEVANEISFDPIANIRWVSFPTTVWLNATDMPLEDCAVGCNYTYYDIWYDSDGDKIVDTFLSSGHVNSSSPHVFVTIPLMTPQRYRIQWCSIDYLNHQELVNERFIDTDDGEPPWSDLTVTLDPDGYFVPASNFNIVAYDNGNPWKIFYCIDQGILHEGDWYQEMHFQINALHGYGPGPHIIEYWAVDIGGNVELPHHKETYVLVEDGPTSTLSFEGIFEVTAGLRYQITPETRINITAADTGCGIAGIYYRMDQGDWNRYTGPFALDEVGKCTVYYYAQDTLGNYGDLRSVFLDIGGGAPRTNYTLTPEAPTGNHGWYVDPVTVVLAAWDEVSGINKTLYRIDDGEWMVYEGPFTVSDGSHSIEYYSIDNVGLAENIKTLTVNVDLYGPEITIEKPQGWLYLFDRAILPLPSDTSVIIGHITITATITDTQTSGVSLSQLYVDDLLRTEGDTVLSFVLNEPLFRHHQIRIEAYDQAGNKASVEQTIWIFNV